MYKKQVSSESVWMTLNDQWQWKRGWKWKIDHIDTT